MKVHADNDVCQAYGLCALSAPEVFAVDEDGYVAPLITGNIPEDLEESAREAIRACPTQALMEL